MAAIEALLFMAFIAFFILTVIFYARKGILPPATPTEKSSGEKSND